MKSIEKPLYDPGPCPDCGGTDVDVDWVQLVNSGGDLDEWIPSWRSCLRESCGRVW